MAHANLSTADVTLVASPKTRRLLILQNIGTTDIWFSFRSDMLDGGGDGLKLTPGASISFPEIPGSNYLNDEPVYAVSPTEDGVLSVEEIV